MIEVLLRGHDNYYGIADILRLFSSPVREERGNGRVTCGYPDDIRIISGLDGQGNAYACLEGTDPVIPDLPQIPVKRAVKRALYILMKEITGTEMPWGCLTGIRPTLVASEGTSPLDLTDRYLVRPDKAELAYRTSLNENRILGLTRNSDINIYIGIPFCPSRCGYCSFISSDAVKHLGLLQRYTEALRGEIRRIAPLIDRRISSLYIGGGTPTVLGDELFSEFISEVRELLPVTEETEFTVEAGRPDTITEHKLLAMKDNGVNRICINPQTMNSETLRKLNRHHSAEDTVRVYEMARSLGSFDINMDLIAGLTYDTDKDLIDSVRKLTDLSPSDITIHTLYKKRRAEMSREQVLRGNGCDIDAAVRQAYSLLESKGYEPYYMYRQKDTGHGLENVGFSRNGSGCNYNVAMMSDRRDVLSFGAGGMSKRIFAGGRLERCPCIKDITGYIEGYEEAAMKKIRFFEMGE